MDKTVDKRTEDALFRQIASIIDQARKKVILTVNLAMVYTYYEIGRLIVQHEQQGKRRADYGQKLLQNLQKQLKLLMISWCRTSTAISLTFEELPIFTKL